MIAQQGQERSQESYAEQPRERPRSYDAWSLMYGFLPHARREAKQPEVTQENKDVSPFQLAPTNMFEAKITGPVKFIDLVAKRWQLNRDETARLFGLTGPAEVEQVIKGLKTLSSAPDIRQRVRLVMQIRSELEGYLKRNLEAERTWLAEYRSPVDDATPIALLRAGDLIALHRVQAEISDYFGK